MYGILSCLRAPLEKTDPPICQEHFVDDEIETQDLIRVSNALQQEDVISRAPITSYHDYIRGFDAIRCYILSKCKENKLTGFRLSDDRRQILILVGDAQVDEKRLSTAKSETVYCRGAGRTN